KKELLYKDSNLSHEKRRSKTMIFRYVFIYYNQKRIYTSNPDGLPPVMYKQLLEVQLLAA
ncbi:hypothetical protein, partial [Johnsonella ignava]|uniref:hypothetical protein n=1 Tax=Johnsonella ignava TaxID=43995 RepID=UPI002E8E5811